MAEAMHDKLLGRISDEIRRRHDGDGTKVVLIAGPSSSGKTTSTKRLAIQLMTNLMTPKMISLDDYFVDRDKTPLDETGDYDYESLYALDLERLNSDLRRLLSGEEINLPTYSFELGRRMERPRPMRLDRDDVLLIEGIHGLNPELTASLPADSVFKVYVSALTTLRIDDHNWISTTDTACCAASCATTNTATRRPSKAYAGGRACAAGRRGGYSRSRRTPTPPSTRRSSSR